MPGLSDTEILRWARAFQKQHDRPPTEDDINDYRWGIQFQNTYGRSPTEHDWQAHWFAGHGGTPEAQTPPAEPTVGALLGLNFPQQAAQLPTYIRDWVRYLEDTVQGNPDVAITNPLASTLEGREEQTPFQRFQGETAWQLGLDSQQLSEGDLLEGWQKFIDSLSKAQFKTQQNLVSLRWDVDKGWYRKQSPMLAHPGEL